MEGSDANRERVADPSRPADPGVVVALEERHGQALFGFVRRLGLDDQAAQDCVQDTLLRLWSELRKGVRVDDPRAWAYRTAYRRAMDEHRVRRRVLGLMTRVTELVGVRSTEPDPTVRIAVWREVDRLPARQRQVLYLRFRADLAFEEIGSVLGVTASAARSHCTQALATLRARLGPDADAGDAR
jgi:RNA polymerase sigma-70 factor (ECF subfamily)